MPNLNPLVRVFIVWGAMYAVWLILPSLQAALLGARDEEYSLTGHLAGAILASTLTVPLVVVSRRWIDNQSVASLGLSLDRQAIWHFLSGAAAFLLPSALGFALVLLMGWTTINPGAPLPDILAFVPLLAFLVLFSEALPEELAFRGYIQNNLEPKLGPWGAIISQALLFALWGAALWSLAYGTVVLDRLVMFFCMALVLGLVREITGTVWASIGLHVAFQTVAQLLLNDERGHFVVTGIETMQFVALGIIPFSLAAFIIILLYRKVEAATASGSASTSP